MRDAVTEQLGAIHAMLASGQRSLRLERHTLLLWGLTGAGLLLASEHILTPEQIPDLAMRATAWLALLSATMGCVGVMDWRMTQQAKIARDETWSFIHRQVLKVWWSLIALAILTTFAMFFLGGGVMVYAVWMAFIGVGLYVHGLFSDSLVEWVGATTILIAIGSLAFQLEPMHARWLATSLFGLGMPLLAAVVRRVEWAPFGRRALLTPLWAAAVMLPAALAPRLIDAQRPDAAAMVAWDVYRSGQVDLTGTVDLLIPAGTLVPLELVLTGSVFSLTTPHQIDLRLQQPLVVRLQDGVATGDIRSGDGPWRAADAAVRLTIPHVGAALSPAKGLRLTLDMVVEAAGRP